MDTQPKRRTTIRDVAARAGVDPSLVSRVVNGDPKAGASATTRERILDAVAELGYTPNVAARGLRMARTFTLGLQLPNITNPMYADIARAAARRAEERGYSFVFGAQVEGTASEVLTPLLRQGRVDGLLVASGTISDRSLHDFATERPGPLVMVNRRVEGIASSVIVDDAAGSAVAVDHLVGLGHQCIAGIFGPISIDTSKRRREGFCASAERHKADVVVAEVGSWDPAAARTEVLSILKRHPEVTAVYASTFLMGMGVLRGARDLGIETPGALSVIAHHDSNLADYLSPALTTVSLPVELMAHRAVDLLINLVDGGDDESIVIDVPPTVVTRDSTGPPF